MRTVLDQLARSTLLPDEMSAAILAGNVPPKEDIVQQVLTGVMDAEAVVRADDKSTWNERRIARLCLGIAFLSAVLTSREESL
jgi:hypothetical protein